MDLNIDHHLCWYYRERQPCMSLPPDGSTQHPLQFCQECKPKSDQDCRPNYQLIGNTRDRVTFKQHDVGTSSKIRTGKLQVKRSNIFSKRFARKRERGRGREREVGRRDRNLQIKRDLRDIINQLQHMDLMWIWFGETNYKKIPYDTVGEILAPTGY